jgi:hypothetical protein
VVVEIGQPADSFECDKHDGVLIVFEEGLCPLCTALALAEPGGLICLRHGEGVRVRYHSRWPVCPVCATRDEYVEGLQEALKAARQKIQDVIRQAERERR